MKGLQFTNKAREDLSSIWDYTFVTWGEEQADSYYNMLINSCLKILKHPVLLGIKYFDVLPGLLGYRVNKHIIFYKLQDNWGVLIIRILHQRMDVVTKIIA